MFNDVSFVLFDCFFVIFFMGRRRILIDVDGVLADLHSVLINLINNKLNTQFTIDQIVEWDIFQSLGIKEHEHILIDAIEGGNFVYSIPPLSGAIEAVQFIEKNFGNVYAVTSPHHTREWMGERAAWLTDILKIPADRQVHTRAKHTVAGCALIDDNQKNLEVWKDHWQSGLPLLWSSPWNRTDTRFSRVSNWGDVYVILDQHLKSFKKEFR